MFVNNHSHRLISPRHTVDPRREQVSWLGKGHSVNSGKDGRWCSGTSAIFLPEITSLLSVTSKSALFHATPQTQSNKQMISQGMHFRKLEYTYQGSVIHFLSRRSTDVIQLFLRYLLNRSHNVWKSHGTTVTSPGSLGIMLDNGDNAVRMGFSKNSMQSKTLQINAKVSNIYSIFKEINFCKHL